MKAKKSYTYTYKRIKDIFEVLVKTVPVSEITSTKVFEIYKTLYGNKNVSGVKVMCAERTIRKYLAELKKEYFPGMTDWLNECRRLVDFYAPNLNKPLHLTGDWVITSDYHLPMTRIDWIETMFQKTALYQVKNLLIAGDLFNFTLLSRFYEKQPKSKVITTDEELLVGKKILDEISKRFVNVVWIFGNHEKNRIIRALRNSVGAKSILDLLSLPQPLWKISPEIGNTHLSFCYLDDIRIEHPKSYSQTKLFVARRLSEKYRCSVLQAHGHFFSLGYTPGNYLIGDTGGFMDAERVDYVFEGGTTTHPLWNVGFMIYKNKKIIPYAEGIGI